jgi:hypothetical protein
VKRSLLERHTMNRRLIAFLAIALAGTASAQTSTGREGSSGDARTAGGQNIDARSPSGSQDNTGAGVSSRIVIPAPSVGATPTAPKAAVVDSSGQVFPIAPPVTPFNGQAGIVAADGQFGIITNAGGAIATNQMGLGDASSAVSNQFGIATNQLGLGTNTIGIGVPPLAPTNVLAPTSATNWQRIPQNAIPGTGATTTPAGNIPGTAPGGGMTAPLPGSGR